MKTQPRLILSVTLIFTIYLGKAQCGCDHTIAPDHPVINIIEGSDFDYQPGDVFCIQSGDYSSFRFIGFEGTEEQPLIFKNCGGVVNVDGTNYSGIAFWKSKFVHITGTGNSGVEYGIHIRSSGSSNVGLGIVDLSSDFEVDHMRIGNTGFAGIMAKTDPNCNKPETWRENYTLRNLHIHDNYIYDTEGEGMYIGGTFGYETSKKVCDGMETFAHLLENVSIHDNYLENTGWDGIQVNLVPTGVEIYNNYIDGYGAERVYAQNQGMSLGAISGRVYNNKIFQNPANTGDDQMGISIISIESETYFFNNIIERPGSYGIWMHQRLTSQAFNTEGGFYFINNTIIEPGKAGTFLNTKANGDSGPRPDLNVLYINNMVFNPGIDYNNSGFWKDIPESYHDFNNKDERDGTTLITNLGTRQASDLDFINLGGKNFQIESTSSAVNAGTDVSSYGVTFDHDNQSRTAGGAYDVGAYEFGSGNIVPTVNISIDQPLVNVGGTVSLDGTTSSDTDGTIAGYEWNVQSGPSSPSITDSNQANASVILDAPGVYQIQLKVTDNQGGIGIGVVSITVNNPPDAVINASQSTINTGSEVTLNGSNSTDADGSIISYQWSLESGPSSINIADATLESISVELDALGEYIFNLEVTDNLGATGETTIAINTKDASENVPPVAVASADFPTAYTGFEIKLDGSGSSDSDGSISSYLWEVKSGPSSPSIVNQNQALATVSFSEEGAYVLELTITDDIGATASVELPITVLETQDCGCDHQITGADNNVNIVKGADFNYQPGDVFCIQAGDYASFRFIDFNGTESEPLTFKNCGGVVNIDGTIYSGIAFWNSNFIHLTGTGSAIETYGIHVRETGASRVGVGIVELSSDFEIDHLQVGNTGFAGIMVKTDPDCDRPETWRENYLFRNLHIHHNYIYNTEGEGMYIGGTFGYTESKKKCGDNDVERFAHLLENVTIHDNYLEDIGWDGIQVNLVPTGVDVYNNLIDGYGLKKEFGQNQGMSLGAIRGRIYNNEIYQNPENVTDDQMGISMISVLDGIYFYNNVIERPGGYGMWFHQRLASADFDINGGFYFINNTIVEPGKGGFFLNTKVPGQSPRPNLNVEYINNIVFNPGSDYRNSGFWKDDPESYFDFNAKSERDGIDVTTNLTTRNATAAGFNNISGNDFNLTESSTAVDAGTNVSAFGITADINDGARPVGTGFDIGAYEFGATNARPAASIELSKTSAILGVTITLDASGSTDADGSVVSFAWSIASGPVAPPITNANSSVSSIIFNEAGDYVIRLEVTDNEGAVGTNEVTIQAKAENVPPNAVASSNKSSSAINEVIILNGDDSNDPDGSSLSYVWEIVSGPSAPSVANAGKSKASTVLDQVGTYSIALTVTDSDGATDSDEISVTVQAGNIAPTAVANASKTTIISGESISLDASASSDSDGSISSYQWRISGPSVPSITNNDQSNASVSIVQTGAYLIELTITDDDGAIAQDQLNITVEQNAGNIAPNALIFLNSSTINTGETVNLDGSPSSDTDGAIVSYSWTINGPSLPSITNADQQKASVIFDIAGEYTINLEVSDDDGASALDSKNVIVQGALSAEDIFVQDQLVEVYPNPAEKTLFISFVQPVSNPSIELVDASGKVIYDANDLTIGEDLVYSLNLSSLSLTSGALVFLRVENANQSQTSRIVIK